MIKRSLRLLLALCMVFTIINIPIMKATEATVIDVTTYGADPSGKYDSSEAFQQAIEAAKEVDGAVTINFPYGEYRFDKDHATTKVIHTSNTSSRSYPEKKIGMMIEEVEQLTIEGNGSTLLFYGDFMALAVLESHQVKLQNFVLDYKDADTIDISVVGTGMNDNGQAYADLYVPTAYHYVIGEDKRSIQWQGEISSITGKPYWTWNNADFCAYLVIYKGYDRTVIRAADKNASNPFRNVDVIEAVSDSVVRFTYQGGQLPTDIVNGNIYQLSNSAWRQTAGAFFYESSDLLVENIDVHYLSGFGWLTQMCFNVEFKGVDFLPREGSGKYTTSNADQLHVAGCGGYFKVSDCNFAMAHDDPINVHGTYMRVEEVIDAQTLRVKYIHGQQGGFQQFHENDEILFYTRTYLEPADGQNENQPFVVKSSIGPGEVYQGEKLDLVNEIITLTKPLPNETIAGLQKTITKNNEVQPLFVVENVTYTPKVTIKGNRMKSIPTRGILCTTRKPVMIEDNIFDNMAMSSIYLSNDADDWYESGPIRNLTIRNNTFYIRPTGQNVVNVSGVFIEPITIPTWAMNGGETSKKDPSSLVHKNITIEGNTFHMSDANVITANKVDGLTIRNNTMIHDDDLKVSLNIPTTMKLGQIVPLQSQVQEQILQRDVVILNDCKNVVMEGNRYDRGMNLNVKLGGSTKVSDIRNSDDVTVNGTASIVSNRSNVKYVTSNPNILRVTATNELEAISEGGVEVIAYIEKEGAIVRSESSTVTISGTEEKLILETGFNSDTERYYVSANKPVKYTFYDVLEDRYLYNLVENQDIYTDEKVDLQSSRPGLFVAYAETMDGETSSIFLTDIGNNSYAFGDVTQLAENVTIANLSDASHVTSYYEDEVVITPQNNGNGIWEGTNYVNNIMSIPIPEDLQEDLILHVDVQGLVQTGSGWNSSGIMLYNDYNNYFFVGKRNHMQGIATMYEVNGKCEELGHGASDNALTDTTLEITLTTDGIAKIRYIDANGTWKSIAKTWDLTALKGSALKLGFVAWKNGGSDFTPTFGNVRMAKASEVNTQQMLYKPSIPLFKGYDSEIPQNDGDFKGFVNPYVGENMYPNISSGFEDAAEIYPIYLHADDFTFVGAGMDFVPNYPGEYYCKIYTLNEKRIYGVSLEAFAQVEYRSSDIDELSTIYMNGSEIDGFASNQYEYDIYLPEEMSDFIEIGVSPNDTKYQPCIPTSDDSILFDDEYKVILPYQESVVVRYGSIDYTLNVHQVKSNDATLNQIMVGEQVIHLSDEIKIGTNSYFVNVDQDQFDILISASQSESQIRVTRSYYEHEVVNAKDNIVFSVNMMAGINAYYIYVTAPDGITIKEYKLYLFHDNYSDDTLTGITMNGKALDHFDPLLEEYVVYLPKEEAQLLRIEAQNKEHQQTSITYFNHRVENTSYTIGLSSGINEVIIANQAKDLWSKKFYTLKFIPQDEHNAKLLSLDVEGLHHFDPDTKTYELFTHQGSLKINATAQVNSAKITMKHRGSNEKKEGIANYEAMLPIYEGNNIIDIIVTSIDGNSETYTLFVKGKGLVYASDVIAANGFDGITCTEQSVGYGSISLDANVNGNAMISLPDENGNKVVFEKGLGVHAASNVVFTFEEGHQYQAFEAYIGVDYVQYAGNLSTITHEIWVDDEKVYDSKEVLGGVTRPQTPMQFVSVDIKGASKVRLVTTDGGDNINYDHSVWADAIFTLPLKESPLPSTVTNLKAQDTSYKSITLTWDASNKATSYDIYRKGYGTDATFKKVATVNEPTYVSSGVMTGKTYHFYVVAKNESGETQSEVVSMSTTLKGKVNLAIKQVSDATFKLSWNQIDGATRYIIYRKRNDDKMKKVLTLGAKELEYTTAELPHGNYQFVVKAGRYDSVDRVMTNASNSVKGNVEKTKPIITLTAGTKQIKVSWKALEGVTHYEVYRATSSSGTYTKLKTTTSTSYTAKSLKSNKKYYFKVRGYKTYKSGTEISYKVYTNTSSIKSTSAK